jgi:hypothetical protein
VGTALPARSATQQLTRQSTNTSINKRVDQQTHQNCTYREREFPFILNFRETDVYIYISHDQKKDLTTYNSKAVTEKKPGMLGWKETSP